MKSLKGHLLVATENLLDPNFFRTVLLMFEHSEEGAAGVILNRPTGATVTDIAEQILPEGLEWDKAIHLGGPVGGPLMILHGRDDLADQPVLEGVFRTAEAGKVEQILRETLEPSVVVANYAGWGPGQLEGEIAEDSWFSMPARLEHVFWTGDPEELWQVVLRTLQCTQLPRFLGLRDLPDDPSVN